ncbi:hypothetical protein NE852_12830 [Rhizobium sp. Pop5]|uniref:hypothetical protein n=1 Tax=Rhizobium sp. Pop5 TaxID=1223565 RepID=UPI000FFB3CAA|nr:hypothetical protein [Rhizobium sp. Pop5]UVD59012.1 hypothetical protein NE852_12830 [Rhizobium sp. Pop5]
MEGLEAISDEHPDVVTFLSPSTGFPVLQKWQLWLAALELEPPVYKVDIMEVISTMADKTPQEKEAIRIMVEDTQAYHREDPRIDLLGQTMGITPAEMDDLWRWASQFQPAS